MHRIIYILIAGYMLGMSIAGFTSMGLDKRRAIKGMWRISERTLLSIAIFGGGLGSYLGMRCFRHKTKHLSFRLLLPAAAITDLILIYYFLVKPFI